MFIYGLLDENGELRYVGKSVRPISKRLTSHLTPNALKQTSHRVSWIKGMLSRGFKPTIIHIQTLNNHDDLCGAEKYWISYFRENGCRLVNMTDGGDGSFGCKQSLETIEKRASKLRGRKYPLKQIKGMLDYNNSNKVSIIDKNGKIFNSICEASKQTSIRPSVIWNSINQNRAILTKKFGLVQFYKNTNLKEVRI